MAKTKKRKRIVRYEGTGFEHMIEDVFVIKVYPSNRSVRAVRDENGDLVLLSSSREALEGIMESASRPGCKIKGKLIKPPTREEIDTWFDEQIFMPRSRRELEDGEEE